MTINVWHEQANVPVTVLRVKGEVRSNAALQTKAKKVCDAGTCTILLDAGVVAGRAHTTA